nr:acyltransferase [Pedobacter panaciterrae]
MKTSNRTLWIDYLRGFITLLVVAHHSSLAYTTFASFDKAAYKNSTHPIVDVHRWIGLDIFEDFNDIFFMSLMFLISGLFVTKGLDKGIKLYLKERYYRLFIPFLIGVCFLMLIAYYPAFLLAYGKGDLRSYLIDFFTVESWPVGPPWFIWVLFVFNIIVALLYPYLKDKITWLAVKFSTLKDSPLKVLFVFYALTWILYIPMMFFFGPGTWTGLGPFDFQVSRIFLYFGYFFIGIIIARININEGIFGDGSSLVKRPFIWVLGCILVYGLVKVIEQPLENLISTNIINTFQAIMIYRSVWTLSCSVSCLAFIILFKRGFRHPVGWWQSLSFNAYGIYLIHYIFVLWCQYMLLGTNMPAYYKFLITFLVSCSISWFITIMIRKIKIVKKYL